MIHLFRFILWMWLAAAGITTARADILVEFDSGGPMTVERNDLGFTTTPRVTATFRFAGDTLPARFNLGQKSRQLLLGYTISDGSHVITRVRSNEQLTLAVDYYPATSRRSGRVIGSVGLLVTPPGSGLDGLQIGMSQDGDALVQAWTDSETRTAARMFRATSKGGRWSFREVGSENTASRRAFAAIAYVNDTRDAARSFMRAAETWESEVKSEFGFDDRSDAFYRVYVRSAIDFTNVWNDIASIVARDGRTVFAIGVFTHASMITSGSSGLEFAGAPGLPTDDPQVTTVNQEQIATLRRMRWSREQGHLFLFGCNTAAFRGLPYPHWSPASEFAKHQQVRTTGQIGYSYFSVFKDSFSEIDSAGTMSARVYLGAYYWHRNEIGVRRGEHMPTVTFPP